nr:MAG TPA: hypothetical protein [Caudoviricetes sp.]
MGFHNFLTFTEIRASRVLSGPPCGRCFPSPQQGYSVHRRRIETAGRNFFIPNSSHHFSPVLRTQYTIFAPLSAPSNALRY